MLLLTLLELDKKVRLEETKEQLHLQSDNGMYLECKLVSTEPKFQLFFV